MQSPAGKNCSKCGTVNDQDAVYCRSCGSDLRVTAVQQPSVPPKFCPNCGNELPSQYAATCPRCGTFLTAYGRPASATPLVQPPYQFTPAPPIQHPAARTWTPNDREALSKMKLYGLIGMVSLIFGFAIEFGFQGTSMLSQVAITGAGSTGVTLSVFILVMGLLAASFVIQLVALFFGRSAFRSLASIDSNFHSPLSLSFALYIGFALFMVGLGLVLGSLIGPLPKGTVLSGNLVALALGGLLLFGGAIALLIGLVGLLLGIWRFGSRYDEGLFKAAAILYIIPVVDIVAPILIYLAANSVEKKLAGYLPPPRPPGT